MDKVVIITRITIASRKTGGPVATSVVPNKPLLSRQESFRCSTICSFYYFFFNFCDIFGIIAAMFFQNGTR